MSFNISVKSSRSMNSGSKNELKIPATAAEMFTFGVPPVISFKLLKKSLGA